MRKEKILFIIVTALLLITNVSAKEQSGIIEKNGTYYCYYDGKIQTGKFIYQRKEYYCNEEGLLQVGFQETSEGIKFFSRDKTRYGVKRTGKFQIGEDYYIFDDTLKTNEFKYEDDYYYANSEGKLQFGFQETSSGTKFFSRDKTRYGVKRTGKFQIGEDYYIFDDALKTGEFKYEDDYYYANSEGKLQFGFQETPSGTKFFSRDKTRYGVMRTGAFMIGYNEYHFNDQGVFQYIQYIPYYYNQKDEKWRNVKYGGKKFGSTGCTPTSLAMAYTAILEKKILPTDVANYLYKNTDEFNKKTVGATGMAIKYASEYYNIEITPIKTKEEMIEALQAGYIIYGAMGEGKFGTSRYNHAVLFYKYENDKTIAMTLASDPLTVANNDWVTIDRVFREQSQDPEDSMAGSNFYKLSLKDE